MANIVASARSKRVIWGVLAFVLTFLLFFSWEDHTWYGAVKAAVGVLFWGVVFQIMEWGWSRYRSRHARKKRSDSSEETPSE
jgi:hypothetical protein